MYDIKNNRTSSSNALDEQANGLNYYNPFIGEDSYEQYSQEDNLNRKHANKYFNIRRKYFEKANEAFNRGILI